MSGEPTIVIHDLVPINDGSPGLRWSRQAKPKAPRRRINVAKLMETQRQLEAAEARRRARQRAVVAACERAAAELSQRRTVVAAGEPSSNGRYPPCGRCGRPHTTGYDCFGAGGPPAPDDRSVARWHARVRGRR